MAQVVAHSSPFAPQHAPHGIKRSAESSLENEQRLSKRFDLLNLGTRQQWHAPLHPRPGLNRRPLPTARRRSSNSPPPRRHPALTKRARTPRSPRASDTMDVEDTPHRVYIHDLAAELSDIESDEENPIFLPDIEKHLSKIPKHVLLGPEPKSNEHNQMVLYNVPASLTVPEERDGVRKAIVEARQRIRNGQANPVMEVERVASPVSSMDTNMNIPLGDDVEAMDID
ncbi:hypothetical protein JI435_047030 [Parastagonospora nodorum SN15]|uniref:Uncharacterized protein n=1 Tax=Phaeosphaeria nodorum (strain SN15 / ATCC MYA-4574 / FGSC 10173) TaxID=321614 RepID=A0A7U2F4Q2_PHANO|nr:hypothetical protein JI435_047030 [Parastagonospora nodorum SN15]